MKVLVVHDSDVNRFPPVLNLIECLSKNNYETIIYAKDASNIVRRMNLPNVQFVPMDSADKCSKLKKVIKYLKRKPTIKKTVRELMKECDVIWTTTDGTVREIGKQLLHYKHVMQLMELIEHMPMLPVLAWPYMNIEKYARHAYKVVVPEYNRAHIQKTWWKLKEVPVVLPNKPYQLPVLDTIPDELDNIKPIISQMNNEKRRILLYQGVFYADRNLDKIADAVDKLSDRYVLYIMGRKTEYREELLSRHRNIVAVPYIDPPYHMFITKNAHIGLTPYVAKKFLRYSILNALYCAPNKIFEYAGNGLPMLGSNVPGLEIPFERYNIGKCYEDNEDSIIECLEYIDKNYDEMSRNCYTYFNSIDMDKIVNSVLR